MQGRGRFESRQAELASISRSLKGLAKELNVPIVALSQLSRAPETRSDHRPQLSDLRESGALEQDADVVMFIYRAEQYRDEDGQLNPEDQGSAEIIIGKQRNGPTGTAKLAFIKEYTRFENLAHGAAPVIRPTVARVDLDAIRGNFRVASLALPRAPADLVPRRASSPSSRRTPTATARRRSRWRSRRRARRCWRAPTSRRPSCCARRACGRPSSSSARSASATSTACSSTT